MTPTAFLASMEVAWMRTVGSAALAMARFVTAWLNAGAIPAFWLVPLLAIAMSGISLQRSHRPLSR